MRYYQIKEAIEPGNIDPNFDRELKQNVSQAKTSEDKKSFIDNVKSVGKAIDDLVSKQIAKYGVKKTTDEKPVEEDASSVILPSPTADLNSIFRACREFIRQKFADAKAKYESAGIDDATQGILLKDVKRQAFNDYKQVHGQGFARGGDAKEKEFAEYKAGLNQKVEQLVKKAEGLKPETPLDRKNMSAVQSSIEAKLKQIIDQMEEAGGKPTTINDFLDLAIQGKIIDMEGLVAARKGKIDDHIASDLPSDVAELFNDEVKSAFFGFIPGGTTAGNYGPAEVGLAILGNPAQKADDGGDLLVGKTKFELKGSGYKEASKTDPKKGTGLYGARLNSKGIGSGRDGWNTLNNEIKKIKPDIKDDNPGDDPKNSQMNEPGYLNALNASTVKGKTSFKLSSRYNFNKAGLARLNKEVLIPNGNPQDTKELLSNTFKAIINGWKKVDGWDDHISSMVDPDGSISQEKMLHHFSALAYDSYNKEDKVENILFINSWNRNYYLIGTQAELLKAIADKDVTITGGITWNDDQQKATPQYARR